MSPFAGLESEYHQSAYLKSAGILVEQDEYVIGWQQTYITDKRTATTKLISNELTGQLVSISKTLSMLASKLEIFVELVKPMLQNNALLTLFCDGIQWKEHELQG